MKPTKILLTLIGISLTTAHLNTATWWPSFLTDGIWASFGLVWGFGGLFLGIGLIAYAIVSSIPMKKLLRLMGIDDK